MQKNVIFIVLGGIAIVAAVTYGGYYLGNIIGKPKNTALNASPTPSPKSTPTPSVVPTATPSARPTTLPTAPPPKATVKAAATAKPTEKPAEISIRFVDTPSKVNSGQSFNVNWFISGPAGKMGTYTKLMSSRNVTSSNGSSSSSDSSQAFGEFLMPQKFVSKMTFSGSSGDIKLKAIAEIDGNIYTATQTIALVD